MVPVLFVDGDLGRGAERDLIVTHAVRDINDRDCPTSGGPGLRLNECRGGRQLTGRDWIGDGPHLGLEYATRHRLKSNLF